MNNCECKKCENCIHYDACKMWADIYGLAFGSARFCEHYKDKSLFVERPCKVGDVVYVWGELVEIMSRYEIVTVNLIDGKFQGQMKSLWVHSKNSGYVRWHEDDFGKTVFLTKEEAERKLSEVEK